MAVISHLPLKRMKPNYEEWVPSQGQRDAVNFMLSTSAAALWADPGAGKTSITLTTFVELQARGAARRMLVIAPLRVCQLVWRDEVKKWAHTRHLRVALLHGPKKDKVLDEALADGTEVFLVNYEGVDWLANRFWQRQLPFEVVVSDEITKLKNHQSKRSKKLRPVTKRTPYKYGLTGTPAPNGYMDLFGQFLWLDGGQALGQYITHFRDMYFKSDFNGFDYVLQAGAADRIEDRIAPAVFRLPYTDLPPLSNDVRLIEFDAKTAATYKAMKKDMLAELPEGTVTAANAAAVYSKLSQMANGAVYLAEGAGFAHIHDLKLDALSDLIEEMNGQPLLVAYEFQHDLARLKARFGKDTPYLGSGVNEATAVDVQERWNSGKIPLLFAHPASVGHGLNLQRGGASHICWFSATWDLELWEQFIRRLWRQGNTADRVVNHILAVKGTIDELKLAAVDDKGVTQARLLQGLIAEISDGPKEDYMTGSFKRLPRAGDEGGAETAQDAAPAERQPIKGWGSLGGSKAAAPGSMPPAAQVDRAAMANKIQRTPPAVQEQEVEQETAPPATGRSFFSPAVQDALGGEVQESAETATMGIQKEPEAKPRATRATKKSVEDAVADSHKESAPILQGGGVKFGRSAPLDAVYINLNGLPPAAVQAALRAIADNL